MHRQVQHLLELTQKYKKLEKLTPEWFEVRKRVFGGSELYKTLTTAKIGDRVIGETPKHMELDNDEKPPKDDVPQSVYCIWGNLFESVAITFIGKIFSRYIYTNMDTLYDTRLPVVYTPDGILHNENEIYLVEIKCPFMRNIEKPIKHEYMVQIQTGMYVTNIPSTKFFQFNFKCCLDEDMHPDKPFSYFRKPHKERFKLLKQLPILKGYFLFTGEKNFCAVNVAADVSALTTIDITKREVYVLKLKEEMPKDLQYPYLCWKLIGFTTKDIPYNKELFQDLEKLIWEKYDNLIKTKPKHIKI